MKKREELVTLEETKKFRKAFAERSTRMLIHDPLDDVDVSMPREIMDMLANDEMFFAVALNVALHIADTLGIEPDELGGPKLELVVLIAGRYLMQYKSIIYAENGAEA